MRKFKRLLLLCCLILCLFGCKKEETADITNEKKLDTELDDTHTKESESDNKSTDSKETVIEPQEVVQLTPSETSEATEKPKPTDVPEEELSEEEKKNQEMEIWIENRIAAMTLEQQVAQLFIVGNYEGVDQNTYPVGGFIYFDSDLTSAEQTKNMLENAKENSQAMVGITAFTAVDEEGGTVTRVAGNPAFELEDPGNMADLGSTGDTALVKQTMEEMGFYLHQLGFNVDFAPVADVSTDISNSSTNKRSFSSDPQTAAEMVKAAVEGLHAGGVCAAAKHFPGLGYTSVDSHEATTTTNRTLEEMYTSELIPFQSAIEANVEFIMVGHVTAPNVDSSGVPATMSSTLIDGVLREELGYDGIVVTDAMNMGAVVNLYGSGEAAVQAILAGADIILMPADFYSAYGAVLDAVNNGTISQERLQESLRRILTVKYHLQ